MQVIILTSSAHYTTCTLTTESSANPITVYHNDMHQQVKRMQVNCRGSFEAGGLAQRVTVN